jgi:hypothetical protein
MTKAFTKNEPADSAIANAEFFGETGLFFASFCAGANLFSLFISKFRLPVVFAFVTFWMEVGRRIVSFAGSSLAHLIGIVLMNRSKPKVSWINTTTIIPSWAIVQNAWSFLRYGSEVNYPRKSRGFNQSSPESNLTIVMRGGASPNPASIGIADFIHFCPKPLKFFRCWVDGTREVYTVCITFIHSSIMFGFSSGRPATTGAHCDLIVASIPLLSTVFSV